jgi:hypothetical protein
MPRVGAEADSERGVESKPKVILKKGGGAPGSRVRGRSQLTEDGNLALN